MPFVLTQHSFSCKPACPAAAQVKEALKAASLGVGAINIRFPERFLRGAFTNPDAALRAAAVQLAAEGCRTAAELGADHVVVWSPYDGYDHYLQVSHTLNIMLKLHWR